VSCRNSPTVRKPAEGLGVTSRCRVPRRRASRAARDAAGALPAIEVVLSSQDGTENCGQKRFTVRRAVSGGCSGPGASCQVEAVGGPWRGLLGAGKMAGTAGFRLSAGLSYCPEHDERSVAARGLK